MRRTGHVTEQRLRCRGMVVSAAVASFLTACQSAPQLPDLSLAKGAPLLQYRYGDLARPSGNSDETLVLLAFSGGGARAAAMAFGVLEALHATRIGIGRNRRSLLSEVDVISSTSGGSIAAAFYGLHRTRMFDRGANGQSLFERRYLKQRVASAVAGRLLGNILRASTSGTNRSDITAEYYDRTLFGGKRYADLQRAGRPYIVINAHDTTKQSRFTFTQGQFDLICSDLSRLPVARAVMASSAVHGVFAPIKLRNLAASRAAGLRCPEEPRWVAAALRGQPRIRSGVETPRDRTRRARLARWYRAGEPYGRRAAPDTRYYVHLADGGLMDNTALWPLLRALDSPISAWGLREAIASGRVKKVLLVVVNAMPFEDADTDRTAAGPSIINMVLSAVGSAQNTASRDAIRAAEVLMDRLRRRHGASRGSASGRVSFHGPVVIEFNAVRNARRRRCFRRIKTALDLPAAEVDALRQMAARQLVDDPGFQSFLRRSNGKAGAMQFRWAADKFCTGSKPG